MCIRDRDYIDAHLDEKISPAKLAEAALYSPWYSYRLFAEHTGLTPAAYIRRLRLSRAAMRIKAGNVRVIDAAFDLGFGSADGFTRAFVREFGVRPCDYETRPVPITLFVPYGVKFRALRKDSSEMKNTNSIFIQVIRKPGTSKYVQGVEAPLDFDGVVPDGFDVIELPETQYMMFQGEPFAEEDYIEAINAVKGAMNSYDPSVVGYVWNDDEPRIQFEPRGSRGYIELRAVKKK